MPRVETMPVTQMQVGGRWVPAIPLPYYAIRKRCCVCGAAFWTEDGYRGHYALAHILLAEPPLVLMFPPDEYTDGQTPLMCREPMAQGDRFCEQVPGHAGAHTCRASVHPHGAILNVPPTPEVHP